MSANLIVDLGHTADMRPSIVNALIFPASGAVIGNPVDLKDANTVCNLFVAGDLAQSGRLRVAVQTSESTASGSFTDPTSGLAQMPGEFSSGGVYWINSGAGLYSGFFDATFFQRPNRYARVNVLSGDFWTGELTAGFISQKRTTGSGAGYSYQPGSGTVNV